MELKELIETGLKYIDFQEYNSQEDITIDLLIKIRIFLFRKSYEWYYEKFPEAYRYDIGIANNKKRVNYSSDGLSYFVNDELHFTSCILYANKEKELQFKQSRLSFPCNLEKAEEMINGKPYYLYYYINEIDHFFTYCFDKYLSGENIGNFSKIKDNGLLLIYGVILQKGKKE